MHYANRELGSMLDRGQPLSLFTFSVFHTIVNGPADLHKFSVLRMIKGCLHTAGPSEVPPVHLAITTHGLPAPDDPEHSLRPPLRLPGKESPSFQIQ